ncbi:DUF6326 family protein [Caulobacter sp.]|uniref:DUF6326 family protein n=1 Tax=Caulobacter sp. TaxID=78 RepID=UPI003BAB5692
MSPKVKMASIWASFMFLYIYVDYFHLYMPGSLDEILNGRVFAFEISQSFLIISFASVALPAIMIFLSVSMPAGLNRGVNLLVATLYIPYSLFNLVGEAWIHMYLGAAIEVALLILVIRTAWTWPRVDRRAA